MHVSSAPEEPAQGLFFAKGVPMSEALRVEDNGMRYSAVGYQAHTKLPAGLT